MVWTIGVGKLDCNIGFADMIWFGTNMVKEKIIASKVKFNKN